MTIDLRKAPLPRGWQPILVGRGAVCCDASVKALGDTYRLTVQADVQDQQFEEAIQILRLMRERGKK